MTLKLPIVNFLLLKNSVFKSLCQEIIKVDSSIRSAGITNEDGVILHISHRKGIKPLLSSEERAQYAITAATRQFTRLRWEVLLGKIQYASSHYSKLIRATIPITDDNRKFSRNNSRKGNSIDKAEEICFDKILTPKPILKVLSLFILQKIRHL